MTQQKFPEVLNGPLLATAQRLADNWETVTHYNEGEHFTLVHGDYHPKQMFFTGERGGRFAVFDWQGVASGQVGADLARILYAGLRPSDVREHRTELLQRYLDGLASGGIDYDASKLERDVQKGLLASLFITVFACGTSDMALLKKAGEARGVDYRERLFGDLGELLQDFRVDDVFE